MSWKLFFEKRAEVLLQINSYDLCHKILLAVQQIEYEDFNIVECKNSILRRLSGWLIFFTFNSWNLMLRQYWKSCRTECSVHSYFFQLLETFWIQRLFAFIIYHKTFVKFFVDWFCHAGGRVDCHDLTLYTLTFIGVNACLSFTMLTVMS